MSPDDPDARAGDREPATGGLGDLWDDTLVCTQCGFCKSVCPAFRLTKDDARSPRAKVMLSYGMIRGDIEPDESVRDVLYICSTCMDCARRCPSNVETLDILMSARRELAARGLVPEGEMEALEMIEKEGNPVGEPRDRRTDFLPEEALERVGRGAEVLVYLGCVTSYSDMKMTRNLFKVMERGEVDYTLLGQEEPCCGMMNYLVGFGVRKFAEAMKDAIDGLDPRPEIVVTPCPGCFRSLTKNYPEEGVDLDVRVEHIIEFLLRLLERGDLEVKKGLEGKVLYHDPCDLGRHTGFYDEPRRLLGHFTEVHEFPLNREEARCCGGGGGLQAADYRTSSAMARVRLMEAVEEDADVVVSACPACKANLSMALAEVRKETGKRLRVMDLTDIVARYTRAPD